MLSPNYQPLTRIFKPGNPITQTSLKRIQRWSLFIYNFDYAIEYRTGKQNFHAEAMSRSPLPETSKFDEEVCVVHAEQIGRAPLNADEVRRQTRRDPVLGKVTMLITGGWPATC